MAGELTAGIGSPLQFALFERVSDDPAVLGTLLGLAFAAFAFAATVPLDDMKRSERWEARITFGFCCLLLLASFAAFVVALGLPAHAETATAVLLAALGGLLLVAILGHRAVYPFTALVILVLIGVGLSQTPVRAYVLGDSRDPYLLRWTYAIEPSEPSGSPPPSAGSISLTLCDAVQTVLAEEDCRPGLPGALLLPLAQLHHGDRAFSADTWEYIFRRPGERLHFVYAVFTLSRDRWGLLRDSGELGRNEVVGMTNFGSTPLARDVLAPMADEDGLIWAAQGGLEVTVDKNSNLAFGIVVALLLGGAIVLASWGTPILVRKLREKVAED